MLLVDPLWHSVFEHDSEVVECLFPVVNRHSPSLRCFVDCHINHFQGRVAIGVLFAVAGELANHTVDGFDQIGRVHHFANRARHLEHGDEMRPLQAPLFRDCRIFDIPFCSKVF